MTNIDRIDRFERELPVALRDVAGTGSPDYLTDILGRTARTRRSMAISSLRSAHCRPGRVGRRHIRNDVGEARHERRSRWWWQTASILRSHLRRKHRDGRWRYRARGRRWRSGLVAAAVDGLILPQTAHPAETLPPRRR